MKIWRRGIRALLSARRVQVMVALMIVSTSSFLLAVFESSAVAQADWLGHDGASLQMVFISGQERQGSPALSRVLLPLADELNLSIAHQPSNSSTVLTVYDPAGRFLSGDDALWGGVDAAAGPVAIEAVQISGNESAESILPDGIELVGAFDADTRFGGMYPTHIVSPRAVPFESGNYLFAVDGETFDQSVTDRLRVAVESVGMTVVDALPAPAPTPMQQYLRWLERGPATYMTLFSMMGLYGLVVVVWMSVVRRRAHAVVEAVVGGSPWQITMRTAGKVTQGVVAACLLGASVALLGVWVTHGASLVSPALRIGLIGIVALLSVAVVWAVAVSTARWDFRKVRASVYG